MYAPLNAEGSPISAEVQVSPSVYPQLSKRKPKRDPENPAVIAEQSKMASLPLPDELPEQTHASKTHRGFGASAVPFNADNSVLVSGKRKEGRESLSHYII